jgi:hypothetical protein
LGGFLQLNSPGDARGIVIRLVEGFAKGTVEIMNYEYGVMVYARNFRLPSPLGVLLCLQ